jgi:hypothetical protein
MKLKRMKGALNAMELPSGERSSSMLVILRQRRRKTLRRDPRPEAVYNTEDDLTGTEALDKASFDSRVENTRSRLGWGITHI